MPFISVNPYTENILGDYETATDDALFIALNKAEIAQATWQKLPLLARCNYFNKLATLLITKHEELAQLATLEMGKTLAEAKLEVLKCARGCEYYATHAEALLASETSKADTGKTVRVSYEPLGVVLGVFPWNFPFWQILRSVIPTIIAGNAMLVKPAPNVPQCSLAIQQLLQECGLPNDLVQVIFANDNQVAKLIEANGIKAVTLTGSDRAGSIVASHAAKHIKKSVLELGGSDPFIVLNDADLDLALEKAITARFQNNGQSCIAAKRFILQSNIAAEFTERLIQLVHKLQVGDPLLPQTNIGPLARKDLQTKLTEQVEKTVALGANIIYQQNNLPTTGFFYPPTILGNVSKQSPAYQEELFGPVITVFVVDQVEEAIQIANDTSFGLGASIWSNQLEIAFEVANRLQCGQVFINEMVKSQPSHPFGGVKKSGYGRELGVYGLKEFCNVKALWF
ncbi:MAG: NAD-dependent succinate-semialdehyde dehydrogenase [Bacteroidetes bacterium]|nr:MAG: NAD-dependent succinate-semialdehyde dehydrogenase [Bacteroidota bacterium]